MRPQGQLKIDEALPDTNDKPGARETDPQGWGDVNLRPPGAPRGVKKRAETKPLGLGAPPPPAGAGFDEEPDAVAGLFATDKAVPAPGITDAPNAAEIGRWVATSNTSLFDDRVKDPAPTAVPAAIELAVEPPRRISSPRALDESLEDPVAIPGMTEAKAAPARKSRDAAALAQTLVAAPAVPAPPAPAPAGPKARVGSSSGARKRSAVAAAAAAAAAAAPASEPEPEPMEEPKRKRRLERGPSKFMLAALGAASLAVLGAAGVLLELVPNPFAESPAPALPARAAAPVAAQPAAAKPAAAKPAAAPARPAAAPAAAAPAVAKAAPAKTAPVAAAPAAAAPKAAAAPSAPQPAPAAERPVVAARAAQPAPAAEATESARDGEESGGGSGKVAQARKLLGSENPEAAEALARQALAADPQDHHAMDVLVRSLMDQDRGADALPFAQRMVQRRGKRVPYRLLLGDLMLMVGNEAGARAEWQKALELAPSDRDIKRRLGL